MIETGRRQCTNSIMIDLENILEGTIEKRPIDISKGVENLWGVSRQTLLKAVKELEKKGFPVYRTRARHYGDGKWMSLMVICPRGMQRGEVFGDDRKTRYD
ncbi:MAG: HTH domain-containing protein [Clostridiales bacterium]|nr:HTH domain-containing protein [Clostridiales bacterium]